MLRVAGHAETEILNQFLTIAADNDNDYERIGVNIKDGDNVINLYMAPSALLTLINMNNTDVTFTILTLK